MSETVKAHTIDDWSPREEIIPFPVCGHTTFVVREMSLMQRDRVVRKFFSAMKDAMSNLSGSGADMGSGLAAAFDSAQDDPKALVGLVDSIRNIFGGETTEMTAEILANSKNLVVAGIADPDVPVSDESINKLKTMIQSGMTTRQEIYVFGAFLRVEKVKDLLGNLKALLGGVVDLGSAEDEETKGQTTS